MMTTRETTRSALGALAALALLLSAATVEAATIPKPDGARSWILVSGSDCDDDGPNVNVDRGHCIGEVSVLDTPGDLGHGQIPNAFEQYAGAMIGPEMMRGYLETTNAQFGWMDMSMVDTYTLISSTLPIGTVVPVTVSFRAVGTMYPSFVCCNAWGSGAFSIKIGETFNPSPIVIPENTRVGSLPSPTASAALPFVYPRNSGADVPIDLTATHTLNVTIGTPFDLAYQITTNAIKSRIDFSNTATINFVVPEGTQMTSTGGYGAPVPVVRGTWSHLKTRFSR
jgi:hypothetical protein